jgi:hypothetical protein
MRIIIDTKPQHRTLFMEMAKALNAKVRVEEVEEDAPPTKEEFLDSLERSYRQAELHSQGKTKLSTLQEFLDEL